MNRLAPIFFKYTTYFNKYNAQTNQFNLIQSYTGTGVNQIDLIYPHL